MWLKAGVGIIPELEVGTVVEVVLVHELVLLPVATAQMRNQSWIVRL